MKTEFPLSLNSLCLKLFSIDSAIACAGFVFALLGLSGLFRTLSSPFNPMGSLLYISIGLTLAISHSKYFRRVIISSFSKETLSLLYEKSLLDLFLEPSPYVKAYTLIGLAAVLDATELQELTAALPPSCTILKERGLVRFLPRPIQSFLLIEDAKGDNFDMHSPVSITDEFYVPLNLIDSLTGITIKNL